MSSELQALENVRIVLENEFDYYHDIDFIKFALKRLEVIESKKVDYLKLEDCIVNMKLETPEYYNKGMETVYCLTQEEYDLFKGD